MEQAIPPSGNPILEIFGKIKNEQVKTFDALKEKDEDWKTFGMSPGYWLVKEYIDNLVTRMDDLEGEAFEAGVSSDEIVMRRAVIRLTKANLLSLTNKVERTTESIRGKGK
jgi:hypothetical protein